MAKSKSTPKPSADIIKPLIKVEGEQHVLQKKLLAGNAPELTSIGYINLGEGRAHNWVSYVIKTKGSEVLSIEVGEPDMRAIAEETAKINFADLFMSVE